MSVKEVDGVRIEDGTGRVTAIDRRQKNAQVSLEVDGLKFPIKAWLEIGDLDVIEGDTVDYEIRKEGEDGFRRYTKLARSSREGQSDQRSEPEPPSAGGPVDASGGGGSSSSVDTTPERVPNSDTQRFESYAFLAACGMVDLAYEELTDAKSAGKIEAVTPALVRGVASALLNAADTCTRESVGSLNRNSMVHTRARGAVRTVLRSYPVSDWLGDPEGWQAALTKAATVLLQVAASL